MSNSPKYSIEKLEYNMTHRCNLKCDFCDHLSPYFSNKDSEFNDKISLASFQQSLSVLSQYIRSKEFLILGGNRS